MTLANRSLAWSQRLAAVALGLFWISFWLDHSDLPAAIAGFEWCFLIPDLLWIGVGFVVASRWLMKGDARAGTATAAAGSALVYLGLLDTVCNWRHGQYTGSVARGALNVTINAACIVFGLLNLRYAMRRATPPQGEPLAQHQVG